MYSLFCLVATAVSTLFLWSGIGNHKDLPSIYHFAELQVLHHYQGKILEECIYIMLDFSCMRTISKQSFKAAFFLIEKIGLEATLKSGQHPDLGCHQLNINRCLSHPGQKGQYSHTPVRQNYPVEHQT